MRASFRSFGTSPDFQIHCVRWYSLAFSVSSLPLRSSAGLLLFLMLHTSASISWIHLPMSCKMFHLLSWGVLRNIYKVWRSGVLLWRSFADLPHLHGLASPLLLWPTNCFSAYVSSVEPMSWVVFSVVLLQRFGCHCTRISAISASVSSNQHSLELTILLLWILLAGRSISIGLSHTEVSKFPYIQLLSRRMSVDLFWKFQFETLDSSITVS